eukprot:2114858-Prymnesium_polylepis.1
MEASRASPKPQGCRLTNSAPSLIATMLAAGVLKLLLGSSNDANLHDACGNTHAGADLVVDHAHQRLQ